MDKFERQPGEMPPNSESRLRQLLEITDEAYDNLYKATGVDFRTMHFRGEMDTLKWQKIVEENRQHLQLLKKLNDALVLLTAQLLTMKAYAEKYAMYQGRKEDLKILLDKFPAL